MGALFSKPPKPPPPPAPAPVPTMDDAKQRQMAADKLAGRRGRAATILTSDRGDLSSPSVGTKTLLGS